MKSSPGGVDASMMRRRVALYGGTFDPVHNGHLAIMRKLHELFALDEALLIPAHVAPHKRTSRVTPALHRYAMLALATQQDAFARISTIELDCPERPFTIETVERVQARRGAAWRMFFVMGVDSWLEIETWRNWERLLALTDVIVVTRPGYEEAAHGNVSEPAARRVVDVRGMERDALAGILANHAAETRVYFTGAVNLDVAATTVRRLAREGGRNLIGEYVPPQVADYIVKYGLYEDEH